MAIGIAAIGKSQSKSAVTSLTSDTNGAYQTGDYCIVVVASDTGTTNPAITASFATFETPSKVTSNNPSNVVTEIVYARCTNSSGGGLDLTLSGFASSDAKAAYFYKLSGVVASSPLDKSATATGSSASPSSGATATLSQALELIVGAIGTEGPSDDTAGSWTTGASNVSGNEYRIGTTGGSQVSNVTISAALEVVNATTAQTAAKTGITSRDWAAAIATFKGATLVAPTANAAPSRSSTMFEANWTSVLGATHYHLDVATDSGFTAFVTGYNDKNVGSGVSASVSGLSPETTYYYRLRASDGIQADSGNSNTITVTTLGVPPDRPLNAAVTNITLDSARLQWDAVTGATGYHVSCSQLDINETVQQVIISNTPTSFTYYDLASLDNWYHYSWSVTAYNDNGDGPGAIVDHFYLRIDSPGNVTVSNITDTSFNVYFNSVLNPYLGQYQVDISRYSNFSPLDAYPGALSGDIYTGLSAGTTYYVRVATENTTGSLGPYSSTVTVATTGQGGGTSTPQSVGGTITITGGPVRRSGKGVSGSSTATGAHAKLASKGTAGSSTATGTATKRAGKGVSGSSAPSGIVATTKVILQAVAGSITAVGGLFRRTGKMVGGAVTGTGAALKRANKGISGASTATGTPTKRANKGVSGSSTGTGAVAKRGNKLASGSITGAGAPMKRVSKDEMEGVLTPSGSPLKKALKAAAGSITLSSILNAVKASTTVIQNLAGSITASGGPVKRVSSQMSGSLTATGAAIKRANKVLAGSITASGVVSGIRIFIKAVGGSITATGAVVKRANKALAGGVTAAGVVVKRANNALAGSVTAAGVVVKRANKSLAGSITASGAVSRVTTFVKALGGSITATGSAAKRVYKLTAGSIAANGVLGTGRIFVMYLSGLIRMGGGDQ